MTKTHSFFAAWAILAQFYFPSKLDACHNGLPHAPTPQYGPMAFRGNIVEIEPGTRNGKFISCDCPKDDESKAAEVVIPTGTKIIKGLGAGTISDIAKGTVIKLFLQEGKEGKYVVARAEIPTTFKIVVGFSPGGGADLWARLLARHMGKYLPGNPELVVENRPGAGGLVAANHLYYEAKPDGLTLGLLNNGLYLDQLAGKRAFRFDVREFNWIGSPTKEPMALFVQAASPYKNALDIAKAEGSVACGVTGRLAPSDVVAKIVGVATETKFRTVSYKGTGEILLAAQAGKIQCYGGVLSQQEISLIKAGRLRALVQIGQKQDQLPGVPTIYELMDEYKTPNISRQAVRVLGTVSELGRPIAAPPKVSSDRVKLLRESFMKVMKDPEVLSQASKAGMVADPSTGEQIQTLLREVVNQPQEVILHIRKALSE